MVFPEEEVRTHRGPHAMLAELDLERDRAGEKAQCAKRTNGTPTARR